MALALTMAPPDRSLLRCAHCARLLLAGGEWTAHVLGALCEGSPDGPVAVVRCACAGWTRMADGRRYTPREAPELGDPEE